MSMGILETILKNQEQSLLNQSRIIALLEAGRGATNSSEQITDDVKENAALEAEEAAKAAEEAKAKKAEEAKAKKAAEAKAKKDAEAKKAAETKKGEKEDSDKPIHSKSEVIEIIRKVRSEKSVDDAKHVIAEVGKAEKMAQIKDEYFDAVYEYCEKLLNGEIDSDDDGEDDDL